MSGLVAGCLLSTGTPVLTKTNVAPVSAMLCALPMLIVLVCRAKLASWRKGELDKMLEVITVALSL